MRLKPFKRVAIVGVGLIGGSIALALKHKKLAKEIVGVTRRPKSIERAIKKGAIDEGLTDVARAVNGADFVVLATPLGSMPDLARTVSGLVMPSTIVIDVGSTKHTLVTQLEKIFRKKALYVGCHPLAGSEKQGVDAAYKELFERSLCIIAKTPRTNQKAFDRVQHLWKTLGATVEVMVPKRHDEIVAAVSHLPHMAAVELVNAVDASLIPYGASGFRDTTRIAGGDPVIWKDICLTNSAPIVKVLRKYITNLKRLEQLIAGRNATALLREFEKNQKKRDKVTEEKKVTKKRQLLVKKLVESKQRAKKVTKGLVVGIDGPVACGKSTVARILANELGLAYLDSGALYRAVALQASRAKVGIEDKKKLASIAKATKVEFRLQKDNSCKVFLGGKDITRSLRTRKITGLVTEIAQVKEVRKELLKYQRALAKNGMVAEGRDMCTVVFPEAKVKVYLDASLKERVERYSSVVKMYDQDIAVEEIEEDVRQRDRKDRRRKESPLRIAKDALYIDTSGTSAESVAQKIAEQCYL